LDGNSSAPYKNPADFDPDPPHLSPRFARNLGEQTGAPHAISPPGRTQIADSLGRSRRSSKARPYSAARASRV
jgi:hypothetical protein